MLELIKENFTESIQTKIAAAEALPEYIQNSAMMMAQCLLNGNKILICGNGASASLAQNFSASLLNRYETERPSLPALALTPDCTLMTAIGTDTSFDMVYSKQVRALGNDGDILVVISAGGHSRNVITAIEAALTRNMTIVALTGKDGGEISGLLGPHDAEIRVPSRREARIQEVHALIINCLCDIIDQTLFPQQGYEE